jgi:hypothetical protein
MAISRYSYGETMALVAPVVDLDYEDVSNVAIVIVDKAGLVYTAGPTTHPMLIVGILAQGINQVAQQVFEASS